MLPNGAPGLQIRRPLGRSSDPSGGRFTFPPTPLPAGPLAGQMAKNLVKYDEIAEICVLLVFYGCPAAARVVTLIAPGPKSEL